MSEPKVVSNLGSSRGNERRAAHDEAVDKNRYSALRRSPHGADHRCNSGRQGAADLEGFMALLIQRGLDEGPLCAQCVPETPVPGPTIS